MLAGGQYRANVQFVSHVDAGSGALVLPRSPAASGGAPSSAAIPAPATSTTVGGYAVTHSGTLQAGAEMPIRLTLSNDEQPVTDL